jgi:hypothetical protein
VRTGCSGAGFSSPVRSALFVQSYDELYPKEESQYPRVICLAPSKMDHKDHFEHLRTVHFSLVITCLGLLVVSTTSQDRTIAGAEAQLRAMQSIVLHWKDLDFDTAINQQVIQSSNELPKDRRIQISKKDDYHVRLAEPAWSPPNNETCSPWLYEPTLKRVPRTLSDAHELWNCLVSSDTFAIPLRFLLMPPS